MPLKLDTLNPYSDSPNATRPLVQANDQTQDTLLHDFTNSGKARIIHNSITHKERKRERDGKRRERGRRNENHGDVERELEGGLDASNSDWTTP